jgi:hypothetical protein
VLDVGRGDGWGANSKLLRGLLRVVGGRDGIGCTSTGAGANVRPKSTSLTCRLLCNCGKFVSSEAGGLGDLTEIHGGAGAYVLRVLGIN